VRSKIGAVEAVVLRSLMSNWQLLRKPRLAIFYGKQSVNAFQEIRRGIQKLDKQTQQAFLQDNEDAYRTLADLLIAQGRLSEAQQVLGMLKEEELFQFVRRDPKAAPALSGTADLNAVEQQAEQQEQALSTSVVKMAAQLDALERLKSRTPAQDAQRTRLNAALNSARQKLAAFIEALPTRFEKGAQSATPNLNELQALQSDLRQLEKKTGVRSAILYTLVGAERTSVIFVGPAGPPVPFSFEIPSEKLNQKVFALRAALQNPRSDPRPLAQGMYEIVFCRGELEKQLEGGAITNLMWSLDGTLRYLPMPALHDGRKYLVERYSMSLWTLGSLARLKDEPQVPWRGLGLGVTQAHTVQTARFGRDSFQALSGVASELRSIVSDPETQGFSTGVLSGAVQMDGSFTKEALGQALREDYAVVHIASHFRLRPGNNADSYLLLGDGAALTLAEMSEMSNARPLFENVDLITLSACETALGGEATSGEAGVGAVGKANGAEVDSFGALAQQQGAGAVLATLWPVADQSTPLLMRAFYRERSEQPTLSKAEVLRRAQAALLTGQAPTPEATLASPASAQVLAPGPGPSPSQRSSRNDEDTPGSAAVPALRRDPSAPYAHPFFWAPFVLIGNWR
jgi:CHAT domain-containing protein